MPPKPAASTIFMVWGTLLCVVFLIRCIRTGSAVEALRFTARAAWLCIVIILAVDGILAAALYLRLH